MADPPITLEDYAFVTAGRLDDIELADLLAYRQLDALQWNAGEHYWVERLAAEHLSELDGELTRLQADARSLWHRPVPPLDSDLRAWLDFQRSMASAPNPLRFVEQHGLTMGDLVWLQSEWQQKLGADRQLAEQAGKILAEPPRPVQIERPARPRVPRAEREPAPEAPKNEPVEDEAPHLSMPLPSPIEGVEGAEEDEAVDSMTLPKRSETAPPPPSTREAETLTDTFEGPPQNSALPFVATPPSIGPRSRTHEGDSALPFRAPQQLPDLSIGHYAALVVELEIEPARKAEILARYGLHADSQLAQLRDRFARRAGELASAIEAYRTWRRFT